MTINESTHNAYCSYLTGNYPPNIHNVQTLVQVCYNLVVANAKAIREFHKLNLTSQVGIVRPTPSDPQGHAGIPRGAAARRSV
ncbi:MAG: family 1 glycosylhydrolase [Merdibacter sp.]